MKQSTIDLLNQAMHFNTEVQEDQLHLQEQCSDLLHSARELKRYSSLEGYIKKIEGTRKAISFCDDCAINLKESCLTDDILRQSIETYATLNDDDRPTYLVNQIHVVNTKTSDYLNRELLNMLECSIADLNNRKQYKTLDEIPDSKTVVYNYHAVDNLTTTYNEILTSICKLGCEDLSYQQLHDKFMEDNELSMVLGHVEIHEHDYTSIDLPSPTYQSNESAEIEVNQINEMSDRVNHVVLNQHLKDLSSIKYGISKRIQKYGYEDAVKSIHFISQIVMAIKNSVLTMQNYHAAYFNEIK